MHRREERVRTWVREKAVTWQREHATNAEWQY
jgi:hypothetical protein